VNWEIFSQSVVTARLREDRRFTTSMDADARERLLASWMKAAFRITET
jgi:hypothetical protein